MMSSSIQLPDLYNKDIISNTLVAAVTDDDTMRRDSRVVELPPRQQDGPGTIPSDDCGKQ